LSQAACISHIHERAFPGIAEQPILANRCDENVWKAIVVVVADGNAHAVEFDIEAGARRHIPESPVPIVVVRAKRGTSVLLPGPVGAIDQQNVLPAIAIVIQKSAARSQSLRQEFPSESAAIVLELI